MNTPPTINSVSQPMAPTKSSKNKQLNKLDIRPKKLLYNDPDNENDSVETLVKDSMAIEEKLKISGKKEEMNDFTKHIEQNELDNEAEGEGQFEHSYNFRRRNKNSKQELKKKSTQKKIVDKENVQLENPSTSDFNSMGLPLTPPSEELNMRGKVIWLQKRRDIGLWIECCNKKCKKWRYVEEYHDPTQVPEKWICSMNSDQNFSSCDAPQDSNYNKCEDDLILNKYNAGSIVWGKINGYPWWPGIVDDCPETLKYYELKGSSSIPVRYHVTFFEKDVSRSWLTEKRIKPLKEDDAIQPTKKQQLVFKGKNYAEDVKKYLALAKSALPISITDRLEKFSFVSRYTGKIITPVSRSTPRKKTPCRIGVFKSAKKRKFPTKSTNTEISPEKEIINFEKLDSIPPALKIKSEIDSPKNFDSPVASCSKTNFQNDTQLPSTSSKSPLVPFEFVKPLPKLNLNSPSESPLTRKITNTPSGPILFDSSKFTSPTSLISTPSKKNLPLLEESSELSFESCSGESFLSIGQPASLPTESAADSPIEKELSQLSLNADDEKENDDSDESRSSSSPVCCGGKEVNRLMVELTELYNSFDPAKLAEMDLEELKKSCNFDEDSSTDSDEEEESKWFYTFESDNGSNSDSSDSDVPLSKTGNKSPKIVKKRIENFDEFLGKALEEINKTRVKPPSPPPEVKAKLKKFLFRR
ncbi:zinc finger CW-type PWWP domain protein 1-like isoform X2 [Leptopilina heterotoma]|nr:zinc finger CW-type PWWP domain protein 1-like isoform X2 [Leptopilina heterotoma]XP_043468483.1 zinc finger CW-type PWWP domain protein 1-like isoform X2 [Leptopilina heterotoma]XP_043468492.1 zinc finger CW-type PWWP domain protein 1-like isoform X2 [Leptopilina heterotoma]XP_043468498.1 zinc finger CW-type PWWP domain protein 1-like isoform X2 [Leptopilina heterotoma]XP_043468508.1 zinc finger CW-type PWWP domain protein 1-like isoform X2 [Leptopilina heterotoma]XP_043468518.1 zinc finge